MQHYFIQHFTSMSNEEISICVSQQMVTNAGKLSLGQGNVFIPMCHSVHKGGDGFPACITGRMTRRFASSGGLHPARDCIQGVGQTPPTPPPSETHGILWDTVNKQAIRILLECILVLHARSCVASLVLQFRYQRTFISHVVAEQKIGDSLYFRG